jgi:NAD(P)-dependent dehydrogenase (short-subunit alcohol dehydrogenase family)
LLVSTERGAVLVTGASSGIGAAAVDALARAGYTVFAGVRTVADARRAERVHNVCALQFDVTDAADVAAAARTIADHGLPFSGLVNNAGIAIAGPLEHVGVDDLRRQFEVNVVAPLALTQAFLPLLRASRGRVVMVGSIGGRLFAPYIAPYGASKAALRALTSALRVELAPDGIRVVLIEPASVRTAIWEKGRRGVDGTDHIGAEGLARYGTTLAALVRLAEREERGAMPVEIVADAILRAMTAPRPRAEQLLGAGARLGSIAALLPAAWRDRVIVRAMQLPQR